MDFKDVLIIVLKFIALIFWTELCFEAGKKTGYKKMLKDAGLILKSFNEELAKLPNKSKQREVTKDGESKDTK